MDVIRASLYALNAACTACRFFTLKHGSRIFYKHGVSGKKMPWSHDEQLFERWRLGKTGMPLVDANMRELKQTGNPPPFSAPRTLCRFRCEQLRRRVIGLSISGASSSLITQGCTVLISAVYLDDSSG